jgi:hypothetical protein
MLGASLVGVPCCAFHRCQQLAQRHSTALLPASSIPRRSRQPNEVVRVFSPFVSGETRPQPTQV